MSYPLSPGQSVQAVVFVCLVLAASFAWAEAPTQQPALTFTVDDPRLEWGPCPEFLPDGCAIAVLHGDPTDKNADVFFKVPAESVIPRHWYTSAERMILVSIEVYRYGYRPAQASTHDPLIRGEHH